MRTRYRRVGRLLMVAAVFTGSACAHPSAIVMPLEWSPTSDIRDLPPGSLELFGGRPVTVAPFGDRRTERNRVGSNLEHSPARPVSTPDDVAAFVTASVMKIFQANGILVSPSGGAFTIKGDVLEFFVTEENTYQGRVVIEIGVSDARGRESWRGVAVGASHRFGRSFKADNYNETLSDCVVAAMQQLFGRAEFQAALRGPRAER
jgi:hypothetical protein